MTNVDDADIQARAAARMNQHLMGERFNSLPKARTTFNSLAGSRRDAQLALNGSSIAPANSASRPIMSASQQRMLTGAGQNTGYVRPRDEEETINRQTPILQGDGLKLPNGNTYKGYEQYGGKFYMNGLPPNTGEHFKYSQAQLDKQAQAEDRRQVASTKHRQAEAIRAQQWVDPNTNANIQLMGAGNPQSQQMIAQMNSRNSQIPWTKDALGGMKEFDPAMQKQVLQAKLQQQMDVTATKHTTIKDLNDELLNIEKGIASRSTIGHVLTSMFDTSEQKAEFIRKKIKELEGAGKPQENSGPPPRSQQTESQETETRRNSLESEMKQKAANRGEGQTSFGRNRQMDFIERLQRMPADQRMEVAQMIDSGVPADKAVDKITAGSYAPHEMSLAGTSDNVSRTPANSKPRPQGLSPRQKGQKRNWMQYFNMA